MTANIDKILELYSNIIRNKGEMDMSGEVSVRVLGPNGKVLEDTNFGRNVIVPRARFVLSRLLAQNLKRWAATTVPHPDWTSYVGDGYIGDGDPGSFSYPFANNSDMTNIMVGPPIHNLESLDVFGGVQTTTDNRWSGVVGPNANQNVSCAYHHGADAIETDLLYALGITGFAFGNGGHLMRFSGANCVTANIFDTNGFSLTDYNSATDLDVESLPAEPYDGAGDHGYSWPGGTLKARYPNLHQPDAFVYEEVTNGVVPYGYSGRSDIEDNMNSVPGTRCVYEGNTTLYSETARYPLDKADGIQFVNGNQIKFKCTIPADSELNQERNYGYARRPRNWITEMGLISGENLLVQSPDPRTAGAIDVTAAGTSNVNGAQLVESVFVVDGAGTWYTAVNTLPKDYYTRLRDPIGGTWFLDANGQLSTDHNNTWNMFARKVFSVLTKQYQVAYEFTWTITFG